MEGCLFCEIINSPDRLVVFENDQAVVLPSKYPAAETHLLIIPKKHIKSVIEMAGSDALLVGELIALASKTAKEKEITDYKLIFNAGKYAQIPHLHLHLLAGNLEDRT
ncbi:MAG: histidine triad nucleotide-binding protein [Candidatus Doudnabacteria bacterium]